MIGWLRRRRLRRIRYEQALAAGRADERRQQQEAVARILQMARRQR